MGELKEMLFPTFSFFLDPQYPGKNTALPLQKEVRDIACVIYIKQEDSCDKYDVILFDFM